MRTCQFGEAILYVVIYKQVSRDLTIHQPQQIQDPPEFWGLWCLCPNLNDLEVQTKNFKCAGWRDTSFKTKFSQIGYCIQILLIKNLMNLRYLFGTLTSFREQKWAFMVGRSHPMPLECGLMWLYGIFPLRNHNIKQKNMLVGSPHKKIWLSKRARARAQGQPNFEKCWECLGFFFTLTYCTHWGYPKTYERSWWPLNFLSQSNYRPIVQARARARSTIIYYILRTKIARPPNQKY